MTNQGSLAETTAVLLMNYGGPTRPEDCGPYIENIFSDPDLIPIPGLLRLPIAKFAAWRRAPKLRANYRAMGQMSPILEQTRAQAGALQGVLGGEFRCFVGMRYWRPFIGETLEEIRLEGHRRIVLLPLYPQQSASTTGSCLREVQRQLARLRCKPDLYPIRCFWDDAGFLDTLSAEVRRRLAGLPGGARVLYCAHGLPLRQARRDTYPGQVEDTVRCISERVGRGVHQELAWQSRVGPMKWLEPSVESVLKRWSGEGAKAAVLVPVAFVSEHSETLYEMDILYAGYAREVGIRVTRVPAVGCAPAFIEGLARKVRAALPLEEAGPEEA